MKILLTGATGFVGTVVSQAILETPGMELRALVRDPRARRALRLFKIPGAEGRLELAQGDILDPSSIDLALDDGSVDAVIHLVGIIAEKPGEGATFERIHTLGTRNVVDAAVRAGIERYVHMSALGVGPGAEARYHKTKWAAEEYVRASELDFTIFRPSIIFGEEDLFINRFAQLIRLRIGTPLPGFGKTRFRPVAVEDVAEVFVQAIEKPDTIGKTYDVVGADVVSLRDMIRAIEDILGIWSIKVPIPLWVAGLQARVLKHMPYPFDLNPDQVTMMKKDNTADPRPLLGDFDLELTPFYEGIKAFLAPDDMTREELEALPVPTNEVRHEAVPAAKLKTKPAAERAQEPSVPSGKEKSGKEGKSDSAEVKAEKSGAESFAEETKSARPDAANDGKNSPPAIEEAEKSKKEVEPVSAAAASGTSDKKKPAKKRARRKKKKSE